MLSKLSIRNAKRSFKDYAIYLVTVILAFSLIFAFNLISNAKEVLELNQIMENFKYAMYVTSVFIVLVVCFLINYTTKFMFQKRSKEFGTYMLLGIRKKDIIKMFILENIIIGFFALLVSIPVGYLISQIMAVIIINIFEIPHFIKIDFNLISVGLLGIYFVFIYVFVLFLARRRIKKMKICDLLYFDKQNEKYISNKKGFRNIAFILSLVLGIFALILFDKQFMGVGIEPSFLKIMIAVILLIISIYGVTLTLADFLLGFLLKRKKLKYKGNNLFVARTFSSKVKSMSFTVGTISVLIALTLVALNISNLFKGMFLYQIDLASPYDITIELNDVSANKFIGFIEQDYTIDEKLEYSTYEDKNNNVLNNLQDKMWRTKDRVVKLSDYNQLLKMKGSKEITLNDNEYYLNVTKEFKDYLQNNEEIKEITLSNGITLKLKEVASDGYTFSWGAGYGYITVVPDKAAENLDVLSSHLIVNTKEKTTEEFAHKLTEFYNPEVCNENEYGALICYNVANVEVRGENEAINKGFMTITSFVCFYLALIFTAVVGTILAIQALSDSTKYKYRYQVLSKLGVGNTQLYKTVFKQLIIFFIFPLFYPIIVSFCTISSLNKLFKIALTSNVTYLGYFFLGLFIFLMIYIIYFLVTYFGFKRNIDKA